MINIDIVTAYNKSFNLNTLILRPFNTFGPRQSQRAVIPTIIQQALKQNKVFLGDLKPRRDFTYVTDTANAFEKAINLNNKFSGEIINLGTGYSVSVLKITNIISKFKKIEISKDFDDDDLPCRVPRSEQKHVRSINK